MAHCCGWVRSYGTPRRWVLVSGVSDIVVSLVFLMTLGVFAANCKTEDEYSISNNVTLEQIQFFYDALSSCGFNEESDVPSSSTACESFINTVVPYVGVSACLTFMLGIYLIIISWSREFFEKDDGTMTKNPISLAIVPIGTLVAMSFAIIGICQYEKPAFCWMDYSLSEITNSKSHLKMTVLVSLILAVYKPLQLTLIFLYGRNILKYGRIMRMVAESHAIGDKDNDMQ